jgi:primosomal protein N' (replication factor Y)
VADVASLPAAAWPQPAEVLGPVVLDPQQARLVVRVPRSRGAALARALQELQSLRSAHKAGALRIQLDPLELG